MDDAQAIWTAINRAYRDGHAVAVKELGAWGAFAAGHWTREPAEVEGWYLTRWRDGDRALLPYGAGDVPRGSTGYRWSAPLPPMPPVPEDE